MREKVEIFKVLSEINRVRILMMLLNKSLCVCEITNVLQLSTATVSNHLAYLRDCGFIEDSKDGKWINYRIANSTEGSMVRTILELLPNWFSEEEIVINDIQKILSVDRFTIKNMCS